MKNLITALSVLTLGASVGNLSSNLNINQKTEVVNTILNQDIKKVSNIDLYNITVENTIWKKLIKNNLKIVQGGNNYYDYYGFYYVIGLNHKLVNDINNALGGGIGGVVAVLNAAFPGLAWAMTIIGAILVAQWYCWEIPNYDKGSGVIIKMIGGLVFPSIIVGVSSQ